MSDTPATLTLEQAYRAMLVFLERESRLTESSDLADLLSDYRLDASGRPADTAVWDAWTDAAAQTLQRDRPA